MTLVAAPTVHIELLPSVSEAWGQRIWTWLREEPEANFDDFGPQTFVAFMADREALRGQERVWGVVCNGEPCGYIQFLPITPRLGTMHLCFAKSVHGQGIAVEAMQQIRDEVIADGVEKLLITFFADNLRAEHFCRRFGAVDEGLFRRHTRTNGRLRDVRVMAIFAPAAEGD